MFNVAFGINTEHPKVPDALVINHLSWRRPAEAAFRQVNIQYGWSMGALEARFALTTARPEEGWFLSKACLVLELASMPDEALHRVTVIAKGKLPGSIPESRAGESIVSSSYIDSMDTTFLSLKPWNFPKGLAHTVNSFQAVAEQFMAQMAIVRRLNQAIDLIDNKHEFGAAVFKLREAQQYMTPLVLSIDAQWQALMA